MNFGIGLGLWNRIKGRQVLFQRWKMRSPWKSCHCDQNRSVHPHFELVWYFSTIQYNPYNLYQRWAYGVRIKIWSRFDVRNRTDICLIQIKICTESVRIEKNIFLSVQTKYRQISVKTLGQTESRFLSVFCLYGSKNIISACIKKAERKIGLNF